MSSHAQCVDNRCNAVNCQNQCESQSIETKSADTESNVPSAARPNYWSLSIRYSITIAVCLLLLGSIVKAASDSSIIESNDNQLPVSMALESDADVVLNPSISNNNQFGDLNEQFHPETDTDGEGDVPLDLSIRNHNQMSGPRVEMLSTGSNKNINQGPIACNREMSNMTAKHRTPGDNGFKIKITGNPEKYTPGELYTGM